MRRRALVVLAAAFLAARALADEEAPPSVMTLRETLLEALAKSPELAKLRLQLAEAEMEEPLLLANTDPQLIGGYQWVDDQAPRAAPAFQGGPSRQTDWNVGIAQNWLTGTQAKLYWRNQRVENPAPFRPLDPTVDSRLALEVRQPLLRYFWGRPDKSRRGRARAGVRAARQRSRHLEALAAMEVVRAYLELCRSVEGVEIAGSSLLSAEKLLVRSREKRRYGLLDESDLLQAEASHQIQETELTLARAREESARNALTSLLQRQTAEGPPPDFRVIFPEGLPAFPGSLEDALATGMKNRGDVAAARAALEAAEMGVRIAFLDTLPDLSLNGSYGAAGLAGTYSGAWKDAEGFDHPVKSAGLNLAVPFGSKREKLDRTSSRLRLEASKQDHLQTVQGALREIRAAWTAWQTARTRRAAVETLTRLQREKLAAEERDFGRGRSSTDMLVRFQLDLLGARQQLLQARADEAAAQLEVLRAAGVLLETLNEGTP